KETYDFLTSLPLSYLHVFTYSKRPHTLAAMMQNHLPAMVKKERTNQLLALSHEKKKKFYQEHCGQERMVLIESTEEHGCLFGFTDNYIKVKTPYKKELINTIINLKVEENSLCMD
ncbi:MAG: tRNA (N(6)-L-threonylcarbamoyladenosine(37)-C(2))-methylthiotransferase MtaB, partial [Bacteroidales bacterium]